MTHFSIIACEAEKTASAADELQPLAIGSIAAPIREILAREVGACGGMIREASVPAIIALFQDQEAEKDSCLRAVRSALGIQRAVTGVSQDTRSDGTTSPASLRIGIVSGTIAEGSGKDDPGVHGVEIGGLINLAVKVGRFAQRGSVCVTEEVFKCTESFFGFETLGTHELEGREEPVHMYRVTGPKNGVRVHTPFGQKFTRFLGRARELRLLLECLERSGTGEGQAVLIRGEAGVGKTRLLYEFSKAMAKKDVTFMEGHCLPHGTYVPYHPIIDMLKTFFDIGAGDAVSVIKEKVRKQLAGMSLPEDLTLPYLLEFFSVTDSGVEQVAESPEKVRAGIIESLKSVILKGSAIRPLVLAIEDFHWVDKSTEELTGLLLTSIGEARVLMILTCRPESPNHVGELPSLMRVNLKRLSDQETLRMAGDLFGMQELDEHLSELILQKTRGIPFYIEEFVRSLRDLNIVDRSGGGYRLAIQGNGTPIASTIQEVIMSRISTLPETAREVLEAASVFGRYFSHSMIARVKSLPEYELLSRLSILLYSGFLYERGTYPQSNYVFKHVLIQETCYHSIAEEECREYHGKIAAALEEYAPETANDHPEVLAHHLTEAGLAEQAIPYWQRAGELAVRRSANVEAIGHLTKTLELLTGLPDTPERSRKELEIQIALAPALMVVKGYTDPQVEQAYARTLRLCRQLGETSRFFDVLRGLFGVYIMRARLLEAHELGKQCLALAERERSPSLALWSHYLIGQAATHLGHLGSARLHLDECGELYDMPRRRIPRALQDPGVACMAYKGPVLWLLGLPEQALECTKEALALARKLSHPFSLAYALCVTALVCQFCRKPRETLEHAEAAIELSSAHRIQYWEVTGRVLKGLALSELEQGRETIGRTKNALAVYSASGSNLMVPYWLAALAATMVREGRAEEGLELVDEALALVEATEERWCEPEVHRVRGELLLSVSSSNYPEAEACLRRAHQAAQRSGAKSLELRALMSLSRLPLSRAQRQQAFRLLEAAYFSFTEGFGLLDLREAKDLLDGIS